jgi:hypothetical protein
MHMSLLHFTDKVTNCLQLDESGHGKDGRRVGEAWAGLQDSQVGQLATACR